MDLGDVDYHRGRFCVIGGSSPVVYRLPDFLVIGAVKCGTTSLASYLGAHESIFMASPKELRFFSHDWDRGLAWYSSKFENARSDALVGEASPQYTQAPLLRDVPDRVASVVPNARLVYMVRDPLDQMRSFYRHRRYKGSEMAPTLDIALTESPLYLAVASYGFQASLYLERFAPEQLLIVDNADLSAKRSETVNRILSFLGIDSPVQEDVLSVELEQGAGKDFLPGYLSLPRRGWRASRRLTGRIPRKWRHSIRDALAKPPPPSAFDVSPDTKRWLADKLELDLKKVGQLAGGSLDEAVPSWLQRLADS